MSCLEKLKNTPGLSTIDSVTKKLVPSIIGILPTPQKIAIAAKSVAALTKNIAEQVAAEVNNTINAVTGKISATANAVKGIGAALKSAEEKFLKAVKGVGDTLKKQFQAVGDYLECEINTMKEGMTSSFEASELQTKVAATATAAGATLTNNQVKELAEDPAKKAEFIAVKTEEVKVATVNNVAKTPSNAQVYQEQKKTVEKLETETAPKEEDDLIYWIPRSRLEQNKTWTRNQRYTWLTGNGPSNVKSRISILQLKGEAGKQLIAILQNEIEFLKNSTEIYPPWPWQRKLPFELYKQ